MYTGSYQRDNASSRPLTEAKHARAGLVLRCGTTAKGIGQIRPKRPKHRVQFSAVAPLGLVGYWVSLEIRTLLGVTVVYLRTRRGVTCEGIATTRHTGREDNEDVSAHNCSLIVVDDSEEPSR